MKLLLAIVLSLSLSSCAAFPRVLAALAKGSQVATSVGHAVDYAETMAAAYYARHPSTEAASVAQLVQAARAALTAYDAAVRTGRGLDGAEQSLREAYDALRSALDGLGVLAARPPAGGAETDAPLPKPFELPTSQELLDVGPATE